MKKKKIDPLDARLRQLITEVTQQFDLDDDDRKEVVTHVVAEYGDGIVTHIEGMVALSINDLAEEEDDDDEDE